MSPYPLFMTSDQMQWMAAGRIATQACRAIESPRQFFRCPGRVTGLLYL
jgi:hypothetical protein